MGNYGNSTKHSVQKQVSDMFLEYDHFGLLGESSAPMSMKQAELYGNQVPLSEPSTQFPVKYPELYSVPKNAKYPEFYMTSGSYNETFYPVDTPNIIPSSSPSANFKQQQSPPEPAEQETKPNNDSEMDYLLNNDGFDLNSLLAVSAANEEVCVGNDPLNLLGLQPSMDELDLLNPVALGCTLPDGIHYSHGFQKDCGSSSKGSQITADPLMTSLYGLPVVDKKNAMDTSSPAEPSNIQFPVKTETKNLVSEESPMSADSLASSHSPSGSLENWEDGLRHLFEQTFDLSDLEREYMFPPPQKRLEDSPSSNMYWPIDKTPPRTPVTQEHMDIPSPHTEAIVPSTPVQDEIKEKGPKSKPKPPLLFGKHEGEIIHKLLAISRSSKRKPITRDKLITIAVEEFNQLLEEAHLSEIEVAFMKEWRRRGKNKAAAQVARKRKREEVSGLDEEVQKMRQQKDELQKRYDHLRSLIESLKKRSSIAEDRIFQKQSQVSREPVSRNTHHIHVTDDDKLLLIPRISSKVLLVKN